MRAVRSSQLPRRIVWADPTIHYLGQVAVESREGSEEPQLTRCAFWPDPIGGPPKGKMLIYLYFEIHIAIRSSITHSFLLVSESH